MPPLLTYTDETGTHTAGRYFVVAGIALDAYHGKTRDALLKAETNSGKEKRDWRKSTPSMRVRYLDEALVIEFLHSRVFFQIYRQIGKGEFFERTADTLAGAAEHFGGTGYRRVLAAHEGFTVGGRVKLQQLLDSRGNFEVRSGSFGARPEIRLADALCGLLALVHCSEHGAEYEHLVKDWFVRIA